MVGYSGHADADDYIALKFPRGQPVTACELERAKWWQHQILKAGSRAEAFMKFFDGFDETIHHSDDIPG